MDIRTINLVNPATYVGQVIFHEEVPYRVIHKEGETITCQELTNEEALHLERWLRAWSQVVRVVEEE